MTGQPAPLTVNDVARALRISRFTVYDLIRRGELSAYRIGNRLRIEPQALVSYKQAQRQGVGVALAAPAPGRAVACLEIGGGQTMVALTLAEVQAHETTTVTATRLGAHSFAQHQYTGVLLQRLLLAAGAIRPVEVWRAALHHYVLASGADGHAAVIALGEIDPAYGNVPMIVAWARAGAPLGADEGPLLLVAPSDHRGGRYVRGLERLLVRDGARPPV